MSTPTGAVFLEVQAVKPSQKWANLRERATIDSTRQGDDGGVQAPRHIQFESFVCSHLDMLTDVIMAKLSHRAVADIDHSADFQVLAGQRLNYIQTLKEERREVRKILAMGSEVADDADVIDLATRRLEEYRQMAERFMALESDAAHQPRPVAVKDETWVAKTTTVRIGESLQYKRIKITGVQPAAGGLPARYRFTVLNPGDKMQTGSSCSEESLLGHYVREQQPSLPGTDAEPHAGTLTKADLTSGAAALLPISTPDKQAIAVPFHIPPIAALFSNCPVNPIRAKYPAMEDVWAVHADTVGSKGGVFLGQGFVIRSDDERNMFFPLAMGHSAFVENQVCVFTKP